MFLNQDVTFILVFKKEKDSYFGILEDHWHQLYPKVDSSLALTFPSLQKKIHEQRDKVCEGFLEMHCPAFIHSHVAIGGLNNLFMKPNIKITHQ